MPTPMAWPAEPMARVSTMLNLGGQKEEEAILRTQSQGPSGHCRFIIIPACRPWEEECSITTWRVCVTGASTQVARPPHLMQR